MIRAAGGVLWRPAAPDRPVRTEGPVGPATGAGAAVAVAVVHRPRYDDWSLPKGKLERGEHPLRAACREVVEETGTTPVPGRRLPSQEYRLDGDRKVVDYWAMRDGGGGFVANDEVDEVRWLNPQAAAGLLSHDADRALLRAFAAVPPPTTTVLLARHARAGERAGWPGEDDLRPLDARGRVQAAAIAGTMQWFRPGRVLSAGPARCVQTVRPLADRLGLPVEVEAGLSEDAYDAAPAAALDLVRKLAVGAAASVLCSQGGVIPDLVATVAHADGLPVPQVGARKGSVWALSFSAGRLAAADYYPDLTR